MLATTLLPRSEFKQAVAWLPLVSIDLLIRNRAGELLVGRRTTPPAKGCWFVPGGRVRKNETLALAFERLCDEELRSTFRFKEASFKGVYEHFYVDDFTAEQSTGTHYVVLAYSVQTNCPLKNLPDVQHSSYRWICDADGLRDSSVHANTRAYLRV